MFMVGSLGLSHFVVFWERVQMIRIGRVAMQGVFTNRAVPNTAAQRVVTSTATQRTVCWHNVMSTASRSPTSRDHKTLVFQRRVRPLRKFCFAEAARMATKIIASHRRGAVLGVKHPAGGLARIIIVIAIGCVSAAVHRRETRS